jgi:hypothetical protein
MTEPIKLPPFEPTNFPVTMSQVEAYARLAVEQATADLRADLAFQTEARLKDAEDFRAKLKQERKERDEARAELARLTTPKQWRCLEHHEIDTLARDMVKAGRSVNWLAEAIEIRLTERNWTPLPDVKETTHDLRALRLPASNARMDYLP